MHPFYFIEFCRLETHIKMNMKTSFDNSETYFVFVLLAS